MRYRWIFFLKRGNRAVYLKNKKKQNKKTLWSQFSGDCTKSILTQTLQQTCNTNAVNELPVLLRTLFPPPLPPAPHPSPSTFPLSLFFLAFPHVREINCDWQGKSSPLRPLFKVLLRHWKLSAGQCGRVLPWEYGGASAGKLPFGVQIHFSSKVQAWANTNEKYWVLRWAPLGIRRHQLTRFRLQGRELEMALMVSCLFVVCFGSLERPRWFSVAEVFGEGSAMFPCIVSIKQAASNSSIAAVWIWTC